MDFREALGRAIAAERTILGLSQTELADAAELSSGTLGKIEHGATSVTYAQVESVAAAMDLDILAMHERALVVLQRIAQRAGVSIGGGGNASSAGSVNAAGATVFGDVHVEVTNDEAEPDHGRPGDS